MDTRTLCLAVLERGEASGYEIKKKLDSPPYSHFQDTSFGSIYPALNRLAEEGAVAVRAQEQEKRPDKKVYSLTAEGRRQLCAALHQPPAGDRLRSDFLFLLFHGDLLPKERVLELVDQRIADLDALVAQLGECCPCASKPMHDFLLELGIDHYRSSARFLRDNRARLAHTLAGPHAQVAE
ncbi:MAG: PadR family transcriptional regulator [Tistlia sp.]|uniref:PadR family transcriptional regulator n=1 Tax=Tistlia sp. TaxID=3057121 RepID=UPI0034A12F6F